MTIAVTGASGRLGRRIAAALLQRSDPADVVLLSRDPGRVQAAGATVRAADFTRPETLPPALDGVHRLVLVSTDDVGARTPQHRTAIEACVAAGVRHVLYTSLPNPSAENPAIPTHEHAETEALLRDSGLAWTMLRNGVYAEHEHGLLAPARETGRLVDNRGDGRVAYVTRDDCAAVAAVVAADGGHEGAVLDVTGPELVSNDDLAAGLAAAGTPVQRVVLDDAAFAEHLRTTTAMDARRVDITVSMGRAIREGWLATHSDVVRELTGRPAQPWQAVTEAG